SRPNLLPRPPQSGPSVSDWPGFAAEATAGRAACWLDQLVDQGHLTAGQRDRIAAEYGALTLARVLRRAELAGHDWHPPQ
ncbi:MAG TPA: hypothetical protein VNA67_09155, partial [Pseudonocardiaceae bacterium]|nr:hypothetical protein [Pseudonocardiaceae bacterium]